MTIKLGNIKHNQKIFIASNALDFYYKVLQNNIQHIVTDSWVQFESLVASLLQTKLLFHNPIYISERNITISNVYNFYEDLLNATTTLVDFELIENYLVEKIIIDIIFIEETKNLAGQLWYKKIITIIQTNPKFSTIPVIIASSSL